MSGSDSQRLAVFLEMRSRLAASRTDTFSRKTMRLNLLRVPTLITPYHLCSKKKQHRRITWLKFGAKLALQWLSF